jgi:putative transposase
MRGGVCDVGQRLAPRERIKACTISREVDGWYVIFTVDTAPVPKPLPKTGKTVAGDVGIEAFLTLSTGQRIENPRFVKNAERDLKTAQRRVSRRKGGKGIKSSNRRKKAIEIPAL